MLVVKMTITFLLFHVFVCYLLMIVLAKVCFFFLFPSFPVRNLTEK